MPLFDTLLIDFCAGVSLNNYSFLFLKMVEHFSTLFKQQCKLFLESWMNIYINVSTVVFICS